MMRNRVPTSCIATRKAAAMAIDAVPIDLETAAAIAASLPLGIGAVPLSRPVDLCFLEAEPKPSNIKSAIGDVRPCGVDPWWGIRNTVRLVPLLRRSHMQGVRGADAARASR
jgi:hypothetical protein